MLSVKMKKLQFITPDMLGILPRFCNKKKWAASERGCHTTSPLPCLLPCMRIAYLKILISFTELLMMNSVCSPTEKLRALLNACKLIIGTLVLSISNEFLLFNARNNTSC